MSLTVKNGSLDLDDHITVINLLHIETDNKEFNPEKPKIKNNKTNVMFQYDTQKSTKLSEACQILYLKQVVELCKDSCVNPNHKSSV